MSERIEFHPLPPEPDKVETPTAKNQRLRDQREGWRDLTTELDKEASENPSDEKAA